MNERVFFCFSFISLIFSLSGVNGKSTSEGRIMRISGGKFIDINTVPYLANLIHVNEDAESNNEPVCGATIITKEWLLTAGHCFQDMEITELKVRTGASERYNDGELHEIEKFIVHPKFKMNEYTISGDIALVKITKALVFNDKQKAISLATPADEPLQGKVLQIAGFGREEKYTEEKVMHLKVASLPIANFTKCQDDYWFDPVTDEMICAGDGDSSCKGDSGGPAVMDGKLVGIISSGFLCDTSNVAAIFTAVNKYLDWIKEYVTFE